MTTDELRTKAIRITRIDELWSRDVIHPVKIEKHHWDAAQVGVTSKGEILFQSPNGELRLHDPNLSHTPMVTINSDFTYDEITDFEYDEIPNQE